MCRSSTTTIGSLVWSSTTSGAGSDTGALSLSALATAVPLLCPVEVPETADEGDQRPGDRIYPQVVVAPAEPRQVFGIGLHQRGTDQLDVDRRRVGLEDLAHPGGEPSVAEAFADGGGHEEDPGEVQPGPGDEWQQLLDVANE